MKQTSQLYEYIQEIHQYIHWQNNQMRIMEEEIRKLHQEMNQMKKEKNVTVERVEYKFDQLKVERLEGTLNIGFTPNGSGSIDDLSMNNQQLENYTVQTNSISPLFPKIQSTIMHYLEKDIYKDLEAIEEKNQFFLKDENYRNVIIEDIKKQIDDRIHLYLNQIEDGENKDENEMQNAITDKIKVDIQNGIQNFFTNFFHKGE